MASRAPKPRPAVGEYVAYKDTSAAYEVAEVGAASLFTTCGRRLELKAVEIVQVEA